jgi:diguanylate cyclase (GGDEF)-like protein
MKSTVYKETFIVIIVLGIIYGIFLRYMILPLTGLTLLHCVISAWIFGFINFYGYYRINKKHLALQASVVKLTQKLIIDDLTGLLNRRALEEDILSYENIETYSVVFADIDNFRSFNNTYGHKIGDNVLMKVSRTIQTNIRGIDKVYRYGGEEIVILLKECSKEDAFKIADKIRLAINDLDNKPYPEITISLGVSSYPNDGGSINEIIQRSDEAMLLAKANGKNCIYPYNSQSSIK